MSNETQKFKPGDLVTWTSQASGKSKTKQGVLIGMVPAMEKVLMYVPASYSLRNSNEVVLSQRRNHESYLIQVGKSKRLYWPLVKYLKLVKPEPLDIEDEDRPYPGEGCGYDAIDSGPPSTWEEA